MDLGVPPGYRLVLPSRDAIRGSRYRCVVTTTAVPVPGVAHMIGMEVPAHLAALIVEFVTPPPRWS